MTRRRTRGCSSRRGVSRREFLKIGGAGLASAALLGAAGCSGAGTGSSGGLVFSFGPDETGNITKALEQFSKQSGISVEYREMPADTGQYFDQLRTQFEAGGGDIDVIGGDVIWPTQFAASGYILDITDRFPKERWGDYLSAAMEVNIYQDRAYGVPWYIDAGMLYYRKDLLEKSGINEPPKTWDELKEMAGKVTRDTGTKYGFVFQGSQYEGGVCDGLEYIWTSGGDVVDPDNTDRVLVDSPRAIEGLRVERSMIESGAAPEAVSGYKEQEAQVAFLDGDAVFMRNWPYIYGLLSDPAESSIKPEQVGVAPLPVTQEGNDLVSCSGGWGFLINAASDKQDEAFELIEFMSSPERQRYWVLNETTLPTRQSLYDDQELLDKVPVMDLGKEAILNTKPRPATPYYSDMSLKMQEQFNSNLRGDTSPEQAAETLQQQLESIVRRGRDLMNLDREG